MKRDAKVGLAVVLVVCVSLAVVFGRNLASQATSEPSVADVVDELDSLEGTITGSAESTEPEADDRAAAPTAIIDDEAIDDLMAELPVPSTPTAPPSVSTVAVDGPVETADAPVETPIETFEAATPATPAVADEPEVPAVDEIAAELPNPDDLEEFGDEPVEAPTPDDIRAERDRPTFAGTEEVASVDVPARSEPVVEVEAEPAPKFREYKVVSGDSLWKISKKVYGRGDKWDLIAGANSIDGSTALRVGRKLKVPVIEGAGSAAAPVRTVEPEAAAPAGSQEYEVKSGDSFWKIAAKELGSGARYGEIAKLNPGVDSATLRVGQKILVPEK